MRFKSDELIGSQLSVSENSFMSLIYNHINHHSFATVSQEKTKAVITTMHPVFWLQKSFCVQKLLNSIPVIVTATKLLYLLHHKIVVLIFTSSWEDKIIHFIVVFIFWQFISVNVYMCTLASVCLYMCPLQQLTLSQDS